MVKVEYGQLIPHDDTQDEDLHLKGQDGGVSNRIKMKVRAILVKLYATMPYTIVFIVASGLLQSW
jgi:hypothetical protein